MNYVILDLEWNTAFSRQKKAFVNEIIEFGAVKLNDDFEVLSTFSEFVKPQISSKLNSHVKKLTHIRNTDLVDADPYQVVYERFGDWAQEGSDGVPPIFMSWGDMDIRTLISNNQYFFKDPKIHYLSEYVDLQAYFMKVQNLPKGKQIGLSDAAEYINEDPDQFTHHRALDDSKLTAVILKKIYEYDSFEDAIVDCDDELYKRILFTPYYIKDLDDKQIDRSSLNCHCMHCGKDAEQTSDWNFSSNSFHAFFRCNDCGIKYRVNISFKRSYNQIATRKTVIEVRPRKKKSNSQLPSQPQKK